MGRSRSVEIFREYAKAAGETAVYADHIGPGEALPAVRLGYLVAGLNDEIQEVLETIDEGWFWTTHVGTADEIGDVLWYNARLDWRLAEQDDNEPTMLPLRSHDFTSGTRAIVLARQARALASVVAGKTKKIIRGDDDQEKKARKARQKLLKMRDVLGQLAKATGDASLKEIATRNVAKLTDRKARGVLKGDGDKR